MSWYRNVYLKSEDWQSLRIRAISEQARNGQCLICWKICDSLDVHHLQYKNLYDVETGDLRVLCRDCHEEIHELYKKYPKLKKQPPSKQWEIICSRLLRGRRIKEKEVPIEEKIHRQAQIWMTRHATSRLPLWAVPQYVKDSLKKSELAKEERLLKKKIKRKTRRFREANKIIAEWSDNAIKELEPLKPKRPFHYKLFRNIRRYKLSHHGRSPKWEEKALTALYERRPDLKNDEELQKVLDITQPCAIDYFNQISPRRSPRKSNISGS